MFVGIVPPDEVVEHLDAFLEPRREHGLFRWSPRERFHVTPAFLAAVSDHAVEELEEGLARAAARRHAFPARMAHLGRRPRRAGGLLPR